MATPGRLCLALIMRAPSKGEEGKEEEEVGGVKGGILWAVVPWVCVCVRT